MPLLPSNHTDGPDHELDASHLEPLQTPEVSSPSSVRTWSTRIGDGTADPRSLSFPSDAFFSGSWTPRARRRVEDAVSSVERLLTLRPGRPVPPFGARWVCVAYDVHDRSVYLAHRLGADHVLRADSVEKLVQKICSIAVDT